MFPHLRKVWHRIVRFFRIKKNWSLPIKSELLIYDACNINIFMKYVKPWNPEILHLRGEEINVWILLLSFFKLSSRTVAYIDTFIEYVNPRLIITFIDNDLSFFTISNRHPNTKTLSIQNGLRTYYKDIFESLDKVEHNSLNKLHIDHMLVYGMVVGDKYASYVTSSVTPLGSLKNNLQTRQFPVQTGVIAYISQWVNHGFSKNGISYSFDTYIAQVDSLILKFLVHYAKSNNKKLMIVPRRSKGDGLRRLEESYFNKLLDSDVEFLEPTGSYSSYKACDLAELVVAVDTSLGYESIARGNKTAIFSIRSSLLGLRGFSYGWPGKFLDEGPFWTNTPNTDSFIRILDYLFDVDDAQWKQDIEKTDFSSLMLFNPDNSILTDTIKRELGISSKALD